MNVFEYRQAKRDLEQQKDLMRHLNRHNSYYQEGFLKFAELFITVYGHAWCMDVKKERRKMARLLIRVLGELDQSA